MGPGQKIADAASRHNGSHIMNDGFTPMERGLEKESRLAPTTASVASGFGRPLSSSRPEEMPSNTSTLWGAMRSL